MNYYKCDGCGINLLKDELRYRVKIEAIAIYEQNEIHLVDLIRCYEEEIIDLLKKMETMTPRELEEQIYKHIEFDFCPSCYKSYISNPLYMFKEEHSEDNSEAVQLFLNTLLNRTKPPTRW